MLFCQLGVSKHSFWYKLHLMAWGIGRKGVFLPLTYKIYNKMRRTCLTIMTCALAWASVSPLSAKESYQQRKSLFNKEWRFHLGDTKEAVNPGFNDSRWRQVDLPHDWSIEGKIDQKNPAGNDGGYFPTGLGWYRKAFTLPSSLKGKTVRLYFEGVYERSEVYVNGQRVGGHPYGYSSFFCDITKTAKTGKNVVAVRVDNSQQKNCRWYSGSGIYRHVWLVATNPVHVADYGVYITTPEINKAVVRTQVRNETKTSREVEVRTTLSSGESVVKKVTVPADSCATVEADIALSNPKLWSPSTPYLYRATVSVTSESKLLDKVEQAYGVRTLAFSAEKGMLLNGQPIKLNGACVHHDNGLLGAASYDRAEERKAELLKAAGFNAVRTSHNPPSEAFLDACDRVGLLVIDESFDGWRERKNKYDYSTLFDQWWKTDVQTMVRRDRNHPSIFSWSTGNEVIERKKIEIVTTSKKLADAVKECDPTRPVTSALAAWDKDWEIYDPLAATLGITGYNYMIHKAPSDHQRVPDRVMMQTESYPKDAFKNWAMMTDHSYIIGDFVWTGMDYLGESGIGRYWYEGDTPGEHYHRPLFPWHGSYCGDIDVTGWRKPISHYRDILHQGTGEKLYMAVKEPDGYKAKISTGLWAVWPTWESWNWPGYEGKPVEVEIYSRYPSVRLYQDGKLVGEKTTGRNEEFKAVFSLPYKEGVLKVEGIDGGKVMETRTLSTAGKPYQIKAVADRTKIHSDGQDLSYVTLEVTDKEGRVVPMADNLLELSVKGAGVLEAAGSADMQDTRGYKTPACKAWKGRALVILKSTDKAGKITLTVKSAGLKPAVVTVVSTH